MNDYPATSESLARRLKTAILVATVLTGMLVVYILNYYPRTDTGVVFANYIGIAPQVDGPITHFYVRENQLVKALPKMVKGATNEDLKNLISTHLEETKGQVERLKQVFEQLEEKPTGEHCKGMEGLVAEGKDQLEKDEEDDYTFEYYCLRIE